MTRPSPHSLQVCLVVKFIIWKSICYYKGKEQILTFFWPTVDNLSTYEIHNGWENVDETWYDIHVDFMIKHQNIWGENMSIIYKKLWKIMIDKEMSKTKLKEVSSICSTVIAKLGKNEPFSMDTMVKICLALDMDIVDVISIEQK